MSPNTLFEDEDITISYELDKSNNHFIHCEIRRWNHKLAAKFYRIMRKAHVELGKPTLFAAVPINDKKLHKFLRVFGWSHYKTTWQIDENGINQVIDLWTTTEINYDYSKRRY